MHPRSEEVLNYIDKTRTELRAAVDSVPSDARNQKPAPDQWSVAQVLDHIAIVHSRVATAIGKWIAEAQADWSRPRDFKRLVAQHNSSRSYPRPQSKSAGTGNDSSAERCRRRKCME